MATHSITLIAAGCQNVVTMSDMPQNIASCKLPPKPRFNPVEETLREAIERGDFDNLPGKGKPLRIEGDSRDEHFLANKLLKDAGYVPAWRELELEIAHERSECDRCANRFRQRSRLAQQRITENPADAAARTAIDRERQQFFAEQRARLQSIAKKILHFNLIVPISSRQRLGIKVEEEMRSLVVEFKG